MPYRLFIAIRPPAPVRAAMIEEMHGVEGARWQDDDQLHLTLRYIGEVDRHRANDLAEALTAIHFDQFEIHARGTGAFERKAKVHTLWAGITPCEPLERLQARVERACQAIGLPPETRKFAPHITLARLNMACGPVTPFLARTGDTEFGCWQATDFGLYESHLHHEGSRYESVARYALHAAK